MTTLESGRRTLGLEGAAVLAAADRLGDEFEDAVELLATAGRVVVTGIGKSGAIAQKIAATFTSTGTPATWMHPVDSLHGDLGLVSADTVAVILSKSGETDELFGLVAALARREVPIVAITGERDSALGRAARVVLNASVTEEACPHGLAPTTSTTVALALGDALAVALLERKGFGREDFAALHPGGRLGRKLLLRVADVMEPPGRLLSPEATMKEVVVSLAHGRGIAPIVVAGKLVGVITAGDLTRLVERMPDFTGAHARDVMTALPHSVPDDALAAGVVGLMERNGILAVPVVAVDATVVGVVHLHDLLRAGAA